MSLLVITGGTDVSSSVEEGSFSLNRQLQNRKDTLEFSTLQQVVVYGNSVQVYERLTLSRAAPSGQNVLHVTDAYIDTNKFRAGDLIAIDILGTHPGTYAIDHIDVSTPSDPQVVLTTNLAYTYALWTNIGRLFYGGVVMKSQQTEIGYSGTFTYKVSCVDYSYLFDRKMVLQDFQTEYPREIMGRIVYFNCANDSSHDLDFFDTAWTQGGVGLAMANDPDRIQGAYSQSTGTSGAGTGTWTQSLASSDLSSYTHARFWWKVAAGYGADITAVKLRLGTDASNYFEYSIANIGAGFEDCWNWESVILLSPTTTVGSPVLTAVVWMQFAVTATAAIPTGNLKFDHLLTSTGGFTLQNCDRGLLPIDDYRVSYQKPSDVLDDLSKRMIGQSDSTGGASVSYVWFIDYTRDVNLYAQETGSAPFNLSNAPGLQTMNYGKLVIDPDVTRLINRIVIIGGSAPSAALYQQNAAADGQQTSFKLDYGPDSIRMWVGAAEQTMGEENQVDETTVQWVWNLANQTVRKTSATTTPTVGTAIVFTYYPYMPILARVENLASIQAMQALTGGDGVFDGTPITDTSIGSFEDARIRGVAELAQYGNAIITATFETNYDGLKPGQTIHIKDVNRSIDQDFLIQKVSSRQKMRDRFTHSVTCGSVLYGIIEFFQMLLKRTQKVDLKPTDYLELILNHDEEITLSDVHAFSQASKTYQIPLVDVRRTVFSIESGTQSSNGSIGNWTNWYASFIGSETGTIQFAAGTYNTGNELRVTAAVGGSGNEARAQQCYFLPAYASTVYTIDAWIRVLAAMTNVSSGGAKLVVKEYSAGGPGGTPLATNVIVSGLISASDYAHYRGTFTSNSSTAWIGIEFSVYQAAGTAALGEIDITPTKTETSSNPAAVSYFQVS